MLIVGFPSFYVATHPTSLAISHLWFCLFFIHKGSGIWADDISFFVV